ncbi:hypothetical protein EYB26_006145 [Talaromyces marneffei]|uniref:2-oxoadipate dioxygenase/decarboxylase n=1 Tax=Talaromyces marneffei (strain ATCC 18224 / CBS 334.59 / QM 7333) TaxID=441960 RepID=B6QBC8_TALMQ|nr:uncharacterized protein EYB26_006145 [Talaromyces marneffei]EEA26437.1 DUF1338 domain protein [Talaromyces marneffei ATCC 18224]QGA18460.1 hypothetical protein EYB26_006145 [Talaromyces marneffei]
MGASSYDADELRTRFSISLSEMYKKEVPLYGTLMDIVSQVDGSVLASQGQNLQHLPVRHQIERHGAIRVGTPEELRVIKRLFAVMGMYPVGYYDLTVVGFPLHSTAFRPITAESLSKNPFRVFTTKLRRDLISADIREKVDEILAARKLFTPRLLEIIGHAEKGSISNQDIDDLIPEALKIFKWHSQSTVSFEDYTKLKHEHPVIADIVCFPSAHINHLTPRTLDIELVQKEMISQGLPAKDGIEGPPNRSCPILLRQTSFRALEEPVNFFNEGYSLVHSTHAARFGEIEQRGAAVTPQGRALYDKCLHDAHERVAAASSSSLTFDSALSSTFSKYPDNWSELRTQGLVYFRYKVNMDYDSARDKAKGLPFQIPIDRLLALGVVDYEPIIYEDFLPFSAAGIFKSNLSDKPERPLAKRPNASAQSALEDALGCKTLDSFDIYRRLQQESIHECAHILGLKEIIVD